MFKFDFYSAEEQASSEAAGTDQESQPLGAQRQQHVARKIEPAHNIKGARLTAGVEGQVTWQSGDLTLVRAVPSIDACPSAPTDSDLVPGVYEGGLKVWEASMDLVEYLASALSVICEEDAHGGRRGGNCSFSAGDDDDDNGASVSMAKPGGRKKNALELGCGHGFPGIMALRQGMRVCFSDFNREVIEQVTVPNVRLNVQQQHWNMAEYYSGDWASLSPLLDQRDDRGRFDLILTAETLYTTEVSEKVLQMILRHLALRGQALVASKRFYFGTGGSTQHFRGLVDTDGRLTCSDVSIVDTGRGNIREILRVTWRDGHRP